MRKRYVVTYDVREAKRLRRIHRKMMGFGDSLQYSVFLCELSAKERVLLQEALIEVIDLKNDQVLIIDIGPAEGRGSGAMETLGRQTLPNSREVVVA